MHPLRRARIDAGLSAAELAEKAGLSTPFVYSLEEGHRRGSIDTWRKLSGVLGVPIDEIAGRDVVGPLVASR